MGQDSPGEVVNLEPHKTPKCTRAQRQKVVDHIVPVLVLFVNAYVLYAFCYEVVWKWVDPRGVRIAIYAIIGFLNLMMFVSWGAIHFWGPGKVDNDYARIDSPDEPFLCGEDGYTLWCSHCQQFKPARAHHSSTEGCCVPVMDHYCIWLGKVIGQGNLKFFIHFVLYSWFAMILILVVQFRYQNQQLPHIAAQSIPVYVISGFWFLFLTALLTQHIYLIVTAQTTLENMDTRHKKYPFFNIPFQDSRRLMKAEQSDMIPGPYHEGWLKNCSQVFGPWYTWLLPIRGPIREPSFNRKLLAKLQKRQEILEAKAMSQETSSGTAAYQSPYLQSVPPPSSHLATPRSDRSALSTPLTLGAPGSATADDSFVTANSSVTADSYATAPSNVSAASNVGYVSNVSNESIASNASLATIVPNN